MNLEQIKTKIIQDRAIHNEQIVAAKKSISVIQEVLCKLDVSDYDAMRDYGFSIDKLKMIDLDRMTTDTEYVKSWQEYLDQVINKVLSKLESDLNA